MRDSVFSLLLEKMSSRFHDTNLSFIFLLFAITTAVFRMAANVFQLRLQLKHIFMLPADKFLDEPN